ncbi:MAG: hypothetical protein AB1432_04245 [Bacteroidota bacterium]|jgi:hypothetical protein
MEKPIVKYNAEQKLLLSLKLYYSAKELKTAAIKKFHPDLSEKEINERVKKIFLYARS